MSFINATVLQQNPRAAITVAAAGLLLVGASLGYWVGRQAPADMLEPSQAHLDSPMTIVNASVSIDEVGSDSEYDPDQLTSTVGKLHADIVTLRLLYRRLAEDAGFDLTDFEIGDAISTPTKVPEVDDELGALSDELDQIKSASADLGDWYNRRSQQRVFGLEGPVVMQGQISSRFGWRKRPSTGEMALHRGVDFSGQIGEPVLALADGVVSFSGHVNAYGYMVEIAHADGIRTRYAHNHSNTVAIGQRVEQGQIIAKLGSTGRSTGPHVHLEVHLDGEPVDPMLFIQ